MPKCHNRILVQSFLFRRHTCRAISFLNWAHASLEQNCHNKKLYCLPHDDHHYWSPKIHSHPLVPIGVWSEHGRVPSVTVPQHGYIRRLVLADVLHFALHSYPTYSPTITTQISCHTLCIHTVNCNLMINSPPLSILYGYNKVLALFDNKTTNWNYHIPIVW